MIGVLFPLTNDRFLRHRPASSSARLTYVDLLGAASGSLFCGFYLIPALGVQLGSLALGGAFIFASIISCKPRYAVVPALALACLLVFEPYQKPRQQDFFGKIFFQESSAFGLVTVGEKPAGVRHLFINRREMCTNVQNESEKNLARIPFQLTPLQNADVLSIGLGCGFTAQALAELGRVARVDVAEINPSVAKATATYFREFNGSVLENRKVFLDVREGFHVVQTSEKSWALIVVDVEEPTVLDSSALYTKDFFDLASSKLKDGGVLALWGFYQPETARIIRNTLETTFKSVRMVPTIDRKILFFASNAPLAAAPVAGVEDLVQQIDRLDISEIATIKANPYAKYFKLADFFDLGGEAP